MVLLSFENSTLPIQRARQFRKLGGIPMVQAVQAMPTRRECLRPECKGWYHWDPEEQEWRCLLCDRTPLAALAEIEAVAASSSSGSFNIKRVCPEVAEEGGQQMVMAVDANYIADVAKKILEEGLISDKPIKAIEVMRQLDLGVYKYRPYRDLVGKKNRKRFTPSQFLALAVAVRLKQRRYELETVQNVFETLPKDFFEGLINAANIMIPAPSRSEPRPRQRPTQDPG